jgi:hypothetical protein
MRRRPRRAPGRVSSRRGRGGLRSQGSGRISNASATLNIAVVAPMPSARQSTASDAVAACRRSRRAANRTSWLSDAIDAPRLIARAAFSSIETHSARAFCSSPKRRSARRRASSGVIPRAVYSATRISRWNRSSSSTSLWTFEPQNRRYRRHAGVLIRRPSGGLGRRFERGEHGMGEAGPGGGFDSEL